MQEWVRTGVVRWVFETTDPESRAGGIVVIEDGAGSVIAVSAFDEGETLLINGEVVPNVVISVVAVSDEWQGVDDGRGVRCSRRIMQVTLNRVAQLWPARPVSAIVEDTNTRSLGLCRRAGFIALGPHPTRPGCVLMLRAPD